MTSDQNRRKFLATAAGAAAFTIVPRHVLGGQGVVAPSDKITLAHIGTGTEGLREMLDLIAIPEIQIVAVCDPNQHASGYRDWSKSGLRDDPPGHRQTGVEARRRRRGTGRPGGGQGRRGGLLRRRTAGRQVQRLRRLRRLPRNARKGKGPERGQDHDAGPPARRHFHRGHEAGQACDRAQAPLQPLEGSQAGDGYGARDRGRHALHAVGQQRIDGPGDGMDQGRLHRHAAGDSQLDESPGLAAVADAAHGYAAGARKVSTGTCGWGPRRSAPYHPNYTNMVFRGWYDFGGGSMADMGHYSLWTVFNALELARADRASSRC